MVKRKADSAVFFTEEERQRITEAIRKAEKQTSGEIRVYVTNRTRGEILSRARKVFAQLGMIRTLERNGVLFYLSLKDRKFAVVGDDGIYLRAGNEFWKKTALEMETDFCGGEFAKGLERGIGRMGELLKAHFPRSPADTNELSDEITGSP